MTTKEQGWLAFLICFSMLLHHVIKSSKVAEGKERPIAYALAGLVAHCHFVKYGVMALVDGTMVELSHDATSRTMSSGNDNFYQLAQITFAYEIYNTLSALIMPEYRTGEFLGHHILTMTIAKFAQTQGPDFYGFFYLGIAALSSLFLVFVDIFRHGPNILRDTFPVFNKIVQVSFAVSFITVRAVTWPFVSLAFWHDTIEIIRHPPENGGPWKPYLFMLLLSNTFLGLLQIMWAKRICKHLVKTLRSKPEQKVSPE
eukprot:CAMPEP_0198252236 /NCGR_PEP_ID=MMETSP1447-20131203/2774_1 /TAXON_ID=420782 /ORGANISM="Chaetoceros dichaeta, Strain CCMP1751" /LENGTH=256 /DNA_ID=CAMNT_0043937415 /DNA_START=43 /DNA_END=813 /DNA_ORIENTATION=+